MSKPFPHHNFGKGGLFKKFITPLVLIIMIAGIIGVFWAGNSQRKESQRHLIKVAQSNAQLLKNLNLPLTAKLNDHLSSITGYTIIILDHKGSSLKNSAHNEARLAAAKKATKQLGRITLTDEFEASAAQVTPQSPYIIATQARKSLFTFKEGNKFLPLICGVILAITSAFMIARAIVKPLQRLTSHTFSLDKELNIPSSLTKRKDEIGILANTLIEKHNALLNEQEKRRNSEKMALLGSLTTSLAHEIKNPASAIIMHARNLETQEGENTGSLIAKEGEEIVSLVNQWLFVAKPEPPKKSNTDLSDLLEKLSKKIHPLLTFHQCQLSLKTPKTAVIACDAQRIEQVFRNLINNAIQAMPQGGNITVSLEKKKNSFIEFKVTDEGEGFSPTALKNFAHSFYSEKEGGMGLGLALVSGVIKAHGGHISVKNNSEKGATITGTFAQ